MATVSYGLKITSAYHVFDETIKIYRKAVEYITDITLLCFDEVSVIDAYEGYTKQQAQRKYMENLIHATKENPAYYERFDKECTNIPILKYYDPFQVFQRVSCASNEDIVAIKEKIIKRARENPEVLTEEMLNLSKLKRLMDEYISGKDITIKVVLLREFAKELGEIIEGKESFSEAEIDMI